MSMLPKATWQKRRFPGRIVAVNSQMSIFRLEAAEDALGVSLPMAQGPFGRDGTDDSSAPSDPTLGGAETPVG